MFGAVAEKILTDFNSIAVVGCSRDVAKAAHAVPRALQAAGYRIIPVNPHADELLLGERAYARLEDVPPPIEVVEVFRPPEEAAGIAESAVRAGAKALWLQQGIVSPEAHAIAEAGGLLYVEDMCMAVVRSLLSIRKV